MIHPVDLLENIGVRVVIQHQEMTEGGARVVMLEEYGTMISNHPKVYQGVQASVGAHPKVENNNNETTMTQEVCTAVVVLQQRVLVAAGV